MIKKKLRDLQRHTVSKMVAIQAAGLGFESSTMAGEVHPHNLSIREAKVRGPMDLLIEQPVYTNL